MYYIFYEKVKLKPCCLTPTYQNKCYRFRNIIFSLKKNRILTLESFLQFFLFSTFFAKPKAKSFDKNDVKITKKLRENLDKFRENLGKL